MRGPAGCHFVPLGDHILDGVFGVGEGRAPVGHGAFHVFEATHFRVGRVVIDVVRGEKLVGQGGVTCVEDLLDDPTDDSLVFF
jgi:hypothetical protein